jgi:sodium transport system permease protein
VTAPGAGLVTAVFATEVRTLVRDRRAFLLAVVLPMALFPLVFLGMEELDRASEESLGARELAVTHDLAGLGPELAARVAERLADPELQLLLAPAVVPAGTRPAEGLLHLAAVPRPPDEPTPVLRLVLDGSSSLANEARRRVATALETLADDVRVERLEELLEADPGAPLALAERDVAPPADALGRELGKLLPMILVLVLISGGSFAALGAFAGEREEGTIETLLVQPVPSLALAAGKFLAVLLTAGVAALGNATSFLLCVGLGLGEAQGLSQDLALGTNAGRLLLGLLLFLPTAVFLSAVLCLVSARAQSFREGQHYVLPLALLGTLLAAISTQDRVPTGYLLAVVPVTGPTLVLRDTLAGAVPIGPALAAVASSALWAWLVLARLAGTLDAERLFRTRDDEGEMAARHIQSRRALRWGFASVVLVFLVGGRLQTADLVWGLLLTLWLLVPVLALLAARGTARRAGESLATTLGLGRPRALHLLGALLIAPALVTLVSALFAWQSQVLPLPSGAADLELLRPLEELPTLGLLFVLALSPGLNEELLFRGALLSGLRRDLPAARVVLWQALLFGAVHASIHRFLPTALLGGVLAALTLRSGRLWPAVVLHTTYNGLLALEASESGWWSSPAALGLGVLGATLLLATGRRSG